MKLTIGKFMFAVAFWIACAALVWWLGDATPREAMTTSAGSMGIIAWAKTLA
jgi:hypothetical protein